ncbi:MAG: hypothetical protein AAGI52_15360 [Bacteroidota bacterium]
MTLLRIPILRRLVAGLALAGLVAPLVPTAEAETTAAADRLVEVLGHSEAVQAALDASRHAVDPLSAFVEAYALATGQDEDDIRAKLDGDALWLATEFPAPQAVLAMAAPGATLTGAPFLATLARPDSDRLGTEAERLMAPVSPDLPRGERPRAHGARGP